MSNCTTGCPTQTCESYSACLKGKGVRVAYSNSATGGDFATQKRHDRELDAYAAARKEGVQPAGTKMAQVETALRISDKHGLAAKAVA